MAAILASNRAREAWEKGTGLGNAWLRFAPENLASEYERAPGFFESLDLNSKPDSGWEILKSLSDGLSKSQYRTELEKEIKEHLLDELFNDQLIATGYRELPSPGQSPVVINPARFETDDPDWREGTLEAHGFRYGRIRITDPAVMINGLNSKPKGGSNSAIDNAIAQLLKTNPEFADLPRKTSCDLVRNYLGAAYKPGNGLSDQNISKAIVRLCKRKRINRNSN
ncbi:hypothetical protein [Aurantiacibacter rhizosphaerae]|uniref:Uncharacterized protein n=1 Tax=Aurantiacibacter rhizosphaerae TaxID=2691582 RepID=A0A844XES6_9SPHN|nr:hypothetical protein [Aurantiacibacter rhizosphaerae]MWV28078.1 hypothetical protein [Aurantiacibacter rhizosphaerae]